MPSPAVFSEPRPSGRGGARRGAGRPRGSRNASTLARPHVGAAIAVLAHVAAHGGDERARVLAAMTLVGLAVPKAMAHLVDERA